jgi:hypothetical protein
VAAARAGGRRGIAAAGIVAVRSIRRTHAPRRSVSRPRSARASVRFYGTAALVCGALGLLIGYLASGRYA